MASSSGSPMDMDTSAPSGHTPAHPGHALAAQLGISPDAGARAWDQVQAAVLAAQQATPGFLAVPHATPSASGSATPLGPAPKKKESPWPKWNGKTGTFLNFRSQLRVKIEEDRHLLGSDRAVCYGMLQALPDDKKARAHGWFDRGGPGGNYHWEDFLGEFSALFEDKQARQAAGEQLTRMRQGSNQYFADFLQDFEYKLQQCGGTNWAGSAKIMQLNASINTSLKAALVTVDLTDDDYDLWKARVTLVASRLEALPTYRPKGATHTKTWYTGSGGAGRSNQSAEGQKQSPRLDADGDTIMGGVNALATALAQALKGSSVPVNATQSQQSGSGDNRPRAPWRSADAVRRLRDRRACLRCEQRGHMARSCPSYGPPIRPEPRIGATTPAPATPAATSTRTDPAPEGEDSDESENGSP